MCQMIYEPAHLYKRQYSTVVKLQRQIRRYNDIQCVR